MGSVVDQPLLIFLLIFDYLSLCSPEALLEGLAAHLFHEPLLDLLIKVSLGKVEVVSRASIVRDPS